jgi:trigger factor
VKSVVEPLEGNKVKLSITVEAAEFESAIDAAWKAIAREVKVPGFRHGKVPRKVLESRIEPGYARSEALQRALPDYYVQAVRQHDVDVIAQPEIDITAGRDEGDVCFDAVVEVRPEIQISGYADLTITIPSPHPSDDDVADEIDRIRAQYADLRTVERPAADGDYVTIDIEGSRNGEALDGLTAEGYLYEVGSGRITAEVDDQLRGLSAGSSVTFDSPHPDPDDDGTVTFAITLHEVKERVLPDLDDAWVAEATSFSTVDELRDDVLDRLSKVRRAQAAMALQARLGEALAELVTDEVPEALIATEMRARLDDMIQRLARQGVTLEQYLQVTGTDAERFTAELRESSITATKVDLALRAIAAAEGLQPTEEELEAEIERLAEAMDVPADQLRDQLERNDALGSLRSDLGNRAAQRWLSERVTVVDEAGVPVRREELELHDDHDHDHDHDGDST